MEAEGAAEPSEPSRVSNSDSDRSMDYPPCLKPR